MREIALAFLAWVFFLPVLPASAANWTVHAQPARLVNGGPVLFQVKSPVPLEALNGSWLGHQSSFQFRRRQQNLVRAGGSEPGNRSRKLQPGADG